jgi:hypothetical protein
VWDVGYFHSIQLITDEEKELIKQEMFGLLDYLSEIASKGCYPETKKKVNLYVSQLTIDTNYSYVHTEESDTSFVHAFGKYELYTLNSKMFSDFKTWMRLKRRSSIQISEVDEKSRVEFFARERQVVEEF